MLASLLVLLAGALASSATQLPAPRAPLVAPPPPTAALAPVASYGTYLGGSLPDRAEAVASMPDGGTVVVGSTSSAGFPVTPGAAQPVRRGLSDAFVARLDADGALLWATFLGGTDSFQLVTEVAADVAVGADGSITVVGTANGADFPVTPGAAQTQFPGKLNGFAARFDADGALLWATYIGGSQDDYATTVALDAQGRAVVAGRTFSDDFPVTPGAFDETENSLNFLFDDAWVVRLAVDGSAFELGTYVGGLLRDEACDVALASDGSIVLAGLTGSVDFPVTAGAWDTSYNGASGSNTDAFLLRLSPAGDALAWSTFYGAAEIVEAQVLVLDAFDRPLIAGRTLDPALPVTPGAFQPQFGGGASDGFLAGFSADGGALRFASFVGGAGADEVLDVVLGPGAQPTLVGRTESADFPVAGLVVGGAARAGGGGAPLVPGPAPGAGPGAPSPLLGEGGLLLPGPDGTLGGAADGFVLRARGDAGALVASAFVGGSAGDVARGVTLDAAGRAWIVGATSSEDLPVSAGAVQASAQGSGDAFVQCVGLPPVLALSSAGGDAAPGARLVVRVRGAPGPAARVALELRAPDHARAAALGLALLPAAGRVSASGVASAPTAWLPLPLDASGRARWRTRWPADAPPLLLRAWTRDASGWTPGEAALLVAP